MFTGCWDSRFVDGYWNLMDDSLHDRIAFDSNFRMEGRWSVEAVEGNGKTRFSLSRGMSREVSLEVGAAIVNDFGMEPGDSSSIAVCLKIKEKLRLEKERETNSSHLFLSSFSIYATQFYLFFALSFLFLYLQFSLFYLYLVKPILENLCSFGIYIFLSYNYSTFVVKLI